MRKYLKWLKVLRFPKIKNKNRCQKHLSYTLMFRRVFSLTIEKYLEITHIIILCVVGFVKVSNIIRRKMSNLFQLLHLIIDVNCFFSLFTVTLSVSQYKLGRKKNNGKDRRKHLQKEGWKMGSKVYSFL